MECAAAAILICATGAALAELAAEILSICVPAGAAALTVLAAAVLRSLRRARTARTAPVPVGGPRAVRLAASTADQLVRRVSSVRSAAWTSDSPAPRSGGRAQARIRRSSRESTARTSG